MLHLVQKDIAERENLINFVFKERLESAAMGGTDVGYSWMDLNAAG
jgi:hypothetical protein